MRRQAHDVYVRNAHIFEDEVDALTALGAVRSSSAERSPSSPTPGARPPRRARRLITSGHVPHSDVAAGAWLNPRVGCVAVLVRAEAAARSRPSGRAPPSARGPRPGHQRLEAGDVPIATEPVQQPLTAGAEAADRAVHLATDRRVPGRSSRCNRSSSRDRRRRGGPAPGAPRRRPRRGASLAMASSSAEFAPGVVSSISWATERASRPPTRRATWRVTVESQAISVCGSRIWPAWASSWTHTSCTTSSTWSRRHT